MTTTPTTGDPMTTAPTPADRLDALCDALAARLRRGPDAEALHPLLDLANIVRDLHEVVQGTPGAPEATPEGDGTTTPVSGPENGARRPGHAFAKPVGPPPLAPGSTRITMRDTTVDWPQASGMHLQSIGSDYLRFALAGEG